MKISTSFRHRAFVLSAVFVTLLVFSCSGDKSTDIGDGETPDLSNPDSLLRFLAKSYADKDLDGYDVCLDESFLFIFTDDIADLLGLPVSEPWWGKTEDLNSTRMMFDDPSVESVMFAYEVVGEWVDTTVVRPDTSFSGFFRRIDPLIEVVTATENPEDPELVFRVDGSWLDVMVVPDRFWEGHWCILSIQEVEKQPFKALPASASAGTEPGTWGAIKSMWH
ncbi:hypothetical protein ACFL2Z_03555 [Candidatus Eisenbacteria bacterium]|uniref:Uncharacterized protein n=1 Tax=Eiseniibacteriota bacterium TaxID=2212470 RepID=A0ABV6YQ06_UNCEI